MADDLRLDDLAREAGVASTTVRLYQSKGLLHGPRVVGRTGYYDESHVARLRLIGRLQDEGFSLAGIKRLLDSWEHGRDLADLVGVEEQLEHLVGPRSAVVVDAAELAARFPAEMITPELLQRVIKLRLVEPTDDGRFRVPDERFLDTGAALADLGIPADVILDEWEHLARTTDTAARRFVSLFEQHLLPDDWQQNLDSDRVRELAATLARLQHTAGQVVQAAFDASLAKVGAKRLGELTVD